MTYVAKLPLETGWLSRWHVGIGPYSGPFLFDYFI